MTNDQQEMSFWQHLTELRKRLLFAVIGIVIGVIITLIFANSILELLAQPIGGFESLLSIEVTENIGVFMRVTLLGGFILSLPFTFLQIYLFVQPALKPAERRWVLLAVPLAVVLFLIGAGFSYFVMLPNAIPVLVQFYGPEVLPKWKDYVDFVTSLIFWSGISFEMPLAAFVLARIGVVSATQLLKSWRIALIVIAFAAAVITPTGDPINMIILMVPLILLFALSILLAALAKKDKQGE
ncbi:twin-arginine translocase subunit TatC [Chloroflexota bacterium]|nr:twin-arginine translocase subunit TatC [Chloroflexota bacterium]